MPKSVSVIVKQSIINHGLMRNFNKFVDRRKQAKLQWLQDSSVVNEDNLRSVRREPSRHFRNKVGLREYLKGEINELE
jgi:hypothetical protein